MEEKKSFAMFKDYLEYMEGMTDQDIGAAMRAVWMVENGQDPPELSGVAWMFFTIIRRDLERASVRAQASRKNGAKGGRPRKEEPLPEPSQDDFPEKPEKTGEEPNHNLEKPNHNLEKPEKTLHKTVDIDSNKDSKGQALSACARDDGSQEDESAAFGEFWELYPKKSGQRDARAAWEELSPDDSTQRQIMDALRRAKGSPQWREENGRYIPKAAKWLRERQWSNVVPLTVASYDIEELERLSYFDLPEALEE